MRHYERSSSRKARILAMVLGFLSVGFLEAEAQQAASFEQLQLLVKSGDTVSVTESTGRMSKGKIAELSRSTLRLLVDGMARDMVEWCVRYVRRFFYRLPQELLHR